MLVVQITAYHQLKRTYCVWSRRCGCRDNELVVQAVFKVFIKFIFKFCCVLFYALDMNLIIPLSTSGFLTPFLIGSYHGKYTCLANPDKGLEKLALQTCTAHETIFS